MTTYVALLRGINLGPRNAMDPAAYAPDEIRLGDRVIYAWLPNGVQGSKVLGLLTDKRLDVTATSRNWNTTTKLLELAGG